MTTTSTQTSTRAAVAVDHRWADYARSVHGRLNRTVFGGQLRAAWVAVAPLAGRHANTNAIFDPGDPLDPLRPLIVLNASLVDGVACDPAAPGYAGVKARVTEAVTHELAHQAGDELYGDVTTGDRQHDHQCVGFILACDRLGIAPVTHSRVIPLRPPPEPPAATIALRIRLQRQNAARR